MSQESMLRTAMIKWAKRLGVVAGVILVAGILTNQLYVKPQIELARSRSCAANVRCVGTSLLQYKNDHDGRFPAASGQDWVLEVAPYLHNPQALICPSDDRVTAEQKLVPGGLWHEKGIKEALLLLRKQGIRLTSYELPESIAGQGLTKGTRRAVLLQETGPGHRGKHHVLLFDGHVVLR